MLPDRDTNVVFISELLEELHPAVAHALKAPLGYRLRLIPGTKDIWCRDFMPIQLAPDRFVQFRYDPDYLKPKKYRHLRTDDAARLLGLTQNCPRSDLVIDGGNIVRWNDAAILTDKIFSENRRHDPLWVNDELRRVLEVDRLVVIPQEPGDDIGHSDGMVRFVDHDTVLVNDYGRSAFGLRVDKALSHHGLKTIPFPYFPTEEAGTDPNVASAIGVYSNFLQIEGKILCPIFGQHEDDDALSILSRCFPGHQIIPVRCNELAAEGGVLNCVTWSIGTESRPQWR